MRLNLFCLLLSFGFHTSLHAAQFTRDSKHVIRMDGGIVAGDVDRLARVYDASVTVLKVRSEGGDTEAGMLLGRFIRSKHLDLEINGLCASSCANYIFPAARRKLIARGSLLAFHGTAYTTALSSPEKVRRMLVSAGLTAERADAEVPSVMAAATKQAELERAFAHDLHIDHAFYREFVNVAKFYDSVHAPSSDQAMSVLWWPSAQRLLACYAIANVDDRARPAVLARQGRYYDDDVSSMIVGDQGLPACPHRAPLDPS